MTEQHMHVPAAWIIYAGRGAHEGRYVARRQIFVGWVAHPAGPLHFVDTLAEARALVRVPAFHIPADVTEPWLEAWWEHEPVEIRLGGSEYIEAPVTEDELS